MAQQFRLVKYYFIYHENYGKTMEKWVKNWSIRIWMDRSLENY